MTSDLCDEDVVRIASPQILTIDSALVHDGLHAEGAGDAGEAGAVGAVGATGAVGAARVQASSAAVELGRRLLLAARAGDTHTVLDLMAKGAPFTTDWLGTSPLHLAAANAHVETCAVLLRAGVSRDSRTKVERTPLHLAAHAGHAAVVTLLLDHGAIVDCRDMLRMTPLHWAAARGHAACARELVRRGADVRARCKFRHTPRALALRNKHRDLAALLDRAEADAEASALSEQMAAEAKKTTLGLDSLTKTPEINVEKPKVKPQPETMKQTKVESKPEQQQQQQQGAAQLLRRHGITLLPADDGSTVLNAIQSGRTVVLSDAGKLMLKESGGGAGGAGSVGGVGGTGGGGVVLTATPVQSPPHGVKIFTLNNKLLVPPAAAATPAPAAPSKPPVKKVINPHDLQQMKFVQLSSEARAAPAPAKARPRGARPAVKIIMNKSNFSRLLASAKPALAAHDGLEAAALSAREAEQALEENKQLRAQLAAAHAALAAAAAELRAARARLARYEGAAP